VNRVLVALDVDSAEQATALADALDGSVAGFKIGKQLFTSEGPSVVRAIAERGHRVFLDLKFHDIPNTVAGAVASALRTGAWMVNVHASGGRTMMEAAGGAASEAAARLGRERPLIVGVTVLTSLDAAQLRETGVERDLLEHVVQLARLAQDSGLDGVVASPREIAAIRAACGPDFLIVTPGIRPSATSNFRTSVAPSSSRDSVAADDQVRTMGPAEAVAAGASYLVVGRPITSAANPRAAAEQITAGLG
jgi:orotidine-5'-phosphate decarboxylase